jgi:hypothetical protein
MVILLQILSYFQYVLLYLILVTNLLRLRKGFPRYRYTYQCYYLNIIGNEIIINIKIWNIINLKFHFFINISSELK